MDDPEGAVRGPSGLRSELRVPVPFGRQWLLRRMVANLQTGSVRARSEPHHGTGQVRAMPSTAWIFETTRLPSASMLAASTRATTS